MTPGCTTQRMGFEPLLANLARNGELVHMEKVAARSARFASLSSVGVEVPETVRSGLGVDTSELWSHQVQAIGHVMAGRNVVVATGTASGKSLCYQLPIALAAAASEGRSAHAPTSLLLFPTKALAQDQLRALGAVGVPGLVPVTYDGDSAPDARMWARRNATCVLTNPDMLHQGLLPYHGRWASFLKRLRFVVVDELHTYRGIFGSHVAHVLRRLQRVCALYGSSPVFISASATVGHPGHLAQELIGAPVECVDDDGSPRGERLLGVWNPPADLNGVPVSGNVATAHLLAGLVTHGYRTIAFTRGRRGAEVVAARARRLVPESMAEAVRPYRGGYLPAERRAIEAEFFSGQLLGVAATNALELGVDVGGLDACICNGFPGTISSFRQQIGRAGRSRQQSLAVLVAGDDALDQWYAAHPSELTGRPAEPVVINPSNPFVLLPQVACAAHEVPITPDEDSYMGLCSSAALPCSSAALPCSASSLFLRHDEDSVWSAAPLDEAVSDAVRQLVLDDELVVVNGRAVYAGVGSPAARVSLRSGNGSNEYRIVADDDRLVGTVDGARAFSVVHPGALYLHQGQQFRVVALDRREHVAWVEAVDTDEYTQARSDTQLRFLSVERTTAAGRLTLCLGRVEVEETVTGFQRKKISTNTVMSEEQLDLPPSTLLTRAFWYEVPDEVLYDAGMDGPMAPAVPGTVHAAEHAGIGMLPLFTICDRWDVGGVSTAVHAQTGVATIVIYDAYPGGSGIAELGFAAGRGHLEATLDAIRRCTCTYGCPGCVQSPKCGNGNDPLDKDGAVALLSAALRR